MTNFLAPIFLRSESVSMVSHAEDSDSEDENGVMEKLASAIGYLFSG